MPTQPGRIGQLLPSPGWRVLQDPCHEASNRMMALQGILLRCPNGPQVRSTVYNVTVMDYEHLRQNAAAAIAVAAARVDGVAQSEITGCARII